VSGESFRSAWEKAFRQARIGEGKRGSLTIAVGFTLATYANPDGSNVYPALSTVADGLGVNRSGVSGAVKRLVVEGWLVVARERDPAKGWNVTHYRLGIPAETDRGVARAQQPLRAGATPPVRGHHRTMTVTTPGTPTTTSERGEQDAVPPAAVGSGKVDEEALAAAKEDPWFEIGLQDRVEGGEPLSAFDLAYIERTAPPFD